MLALKPARMPPLNALRAFEMTGRLCSVKHAATQLNVTPGAVSRQIAQLEEHLGVRLFERTSRGLRLTTSGAAFHLQLCEGFRILRQATQQVVDSQRMRPLHIWASTTFAMRWLLPRLQTFHLLGGATDFTMTTSLRPVDFDAPENVDLAIRVGRGEWPNACAERLFTTRLLPVCSPALLERKPLRSIYDLARHALLHAAPRREDWNTWMRAQGEAQVEAAHHIEFETSALAYQAAAAGIGVALGQLALVQEDLQAGRLLAPLSCQSDEATFFLIYPDRSARRRDFMQFREWLLKEANQHEQEMIEWTRVHNA